MSEYQNDPAWQFLRQSQDQVKFIGFQAVRRQLKRLFFQKWAICRCTNVTVVSLSQLTIFQIVAATSKKFDSKRNVWIPDREEGFIAAEIKSIKDDLVTVITCKGAEVCFFREFQNYQICHHIKSKRSVLLQWTGRFFAMFHLGISSRYGSVSALQSQSMAARKLKELLEDPEDGTSHFVYHQIVQEVVIKGKILQLWEVVPCERTQNSYVWHLAMCHGSILHWESKHFS